jgi:hypothetical protein
MSRAIDRKRQRRWKKAQTYEYKIEENETHYCNGVSEKVFQKAKQKFIKACENNDLQAAKKAYVAGNMYKGGRRPIFDACRICKSPEIIEWLFSIRGGCYGGSHDHVETMINNKKVSIQNWVCWPHTGIDYYHDHTDFDHILISNHCNPVIAKWIISLDRFEQSFIEKHFKDDHINLWFECGFVPNSYYERSYALYDKFKQRVAHEMSTLHNVTIFNTNDLINIIIDFIGGKIDFSNV